MAEGINMGSKSPWTKEEYVSVYNRVKNYTNQPHITSINAL